MKRHLDSFEHKNSEEVEKLQNKEILNISLPSNLEKDKATENVCTGVQLMAAYNLPYCFWPLFCTILNIMAKNSEGKEIKSFVGNNNQSHIHTFTIHIAIFGHIHSVTRHHSYVCHALSFHTF